jgi:hypothetical protein
MSVPNGNIIYQPFPFQGPPKFTQFGIFGLKIYSIWQPDGSRVTIMGEFSPIGPLFTFGSFLNHNLMGYYFRGNISYLM